MVMLVFFDHLQFSYLVIGHKDGSNTWALGIRAFLICNNRLVFQRLLSLSNTQDQHDIFDDAQMSDKLPEQFIRHNQIDDCSNITKY